MNDIINEGDNLPNPESENTAKIVYVLYLVAIFFGITGIVGVVMAYVNKESAPQWLQTHYRFQIRTFWIGGVYLFLGATLSLVLIGWLILLFWVIWLIIRVVKGLKMLGDKKAHNNPTTWMF